MSMMDDYGESDRDTASSGTRPIVEHAREIRRDASALAEDLRGTKRELESALGEELTQRPLRAVGIALGVGYVLGGGLTSRLTYSMLGMATRLTTMTMLARELYELCRRWQAEEQGEGTAARQRGEGQPEPASPYSGMGGGSAMGSGSYQGPTAQESSPRAGSGNEEIGGRKPPTETHH